MTLRPAQRYATTPGQIALAWLLHHGPHMIVIPGTTSVAHLEENVAAQHVTLSDDDMAALAPLGKGA